MIKPITALVLCDVPAHGLKAGCLVEAEAATVKALTAYGSADASKDAVAYARSQGAPVVRSCIELKAEAQATEANALRVEIAGLEDLLGKATDEPTKAALMADLVGKREALAALV